MACRRLGLRKKDAKILLYTLESTSQRVQTEFSDSEEFYKRNYFHTFFGTGKGSGGSQTFWFTVAEVMFSCIDEDLALFRLQNPAVTIIHQCNEYSFVDETSILVDACNGDVVDTLQKIFHIHERYLYDKGGRLVLTNFFWLLVEWTLDEGKEILADIDYD